MVVCLVCWAVCSTTVTTEDVYTTHILNLSIFCTFVCLVLFLMPGFSSNKFLVDVMTTMDTDDTNALGIAIDVEYTFMYVDNKHRFKGLNNNDKLCTKC